MPTYLKVLGGGLLLLLAGCASTKPISYLTVEECGQEVFALFVDSDGEQLMLNPDINLEAIYWIEQIPKDNRNTYTIPCKIST